MKEHPILFNSDMVRAVRAGGKTQTRRVVRGVEECPHGYDEVRRITQQEDHFLFDFASGESAAIKCPYGVVGDRLWGREAWRTWNGWDKLPPRDLAENSHIRYEADGAYKNGRKPRGSDEVWGKLRPGMFMPRWASRITRTVARVRVERLNDISERDAIAEGIDAHRASSKCPLLYRDYSLAFNDPFEWFRNPIDSYRTLWEKINGPGSWKANPLVWVVEFR